MQTTKANIGPSLSYLFKALNSLIIGVSIYFFTAIVGKVLLSKTPEVFGIPIAQQNSIYVLMFCTIIHIILLRYIIHYFRLAWSGLDRGQREELYFKLTGGNNFLTMGAESLRDSIHNKDGFLFVRVTKKDPPSFLHGIIFITAVFSSVRYEISFDFVWTFVIGLTLSMANWQIGSSWLVALADLGRDSNESLYFDDPEKNGPRYFGIVSGPWNGMNNNIFLYSAISLLDAFLRVIKPSVLAFVVWIALEFIFFIVAWFQNS